MAQAHEPSDGLRLCDHPLGLSQHFDARLCCECQQQQEKLLWQAVVDTGLYAYFFLRQLCDFFVSCGMSEAVYTFFEEFAERLRLFPRFRNLMHFLGLVTICDHPAVISARVSGSATTCTVNSRGVSRSATTRLLFRQSQALWPA